MIFDYIRYLDTNGWILLEENDFFSINDKDIYGQNPIYYAAREGHLNLCELLFEKGTDINLEDKFYKCRIFSFISFFML